MVSDFFYPNMGGVESHIFQLSQCLLEKGHKVIVVTHSYDDRIGIRYMTNYLKVYYLPIVPFYNQSILPTIIGSLPYLRKIFLTEKVDIVHGHSAFSSLAHEALFVASLLDIPAVFTDHSLFGFSDASAIVTNAFLRYSLANASHTICVSHTGKENTVLRSGVSAENVSVISNAVDAVKFRPKYCNRRTTPSDENKLVDANKTKLLDENELHDGKQTKVLNTEKLSKIDDKQLLGVAVYKETKLLDVNDDEETKLLDVNDDEETKLSNVKRHVPNNDASHKSCTDSRNCTDRPSILYNNSIVTSENTRKIFNKSTVTIVIGSRLVYRKGIDLIPGLLPVLCDQGIKVGGRTIKVNFIIAGDGPKRIIIEEVIEKHKLQKRVKMLGELKHSDMRDKLLVKGDIFLNTSLTEAFCMAIVEAVACGLTVVSTGVGGIPEVLPPRFIYLVQPNLDSILKGIYQAIEDLVGGRRPSAGECNRFVRSAYCWRNVAGRTENVYNTIKTRQTPTLAKKVRNLWECGPMAGPMMAMIYLACNYVILFLNWFSPLN